MKDRIIINFKTKWLMLTIAGSALASVVAWEYSILHIANSDYIRIEWEHFGVGIIIAAIFGALILPLFTKGFLLHFLQAMLLLLSIGPVICFFGFSPALEPVGYILFLFCRGIPSEFLNCFVLIPINTFGPLLVFFAGYFASIFMQMQKLEDQTSKNSAIADISGK